MPLFYFDYYDDSGTLRDDIGSDLVDLDAATIEASKIMGELAADALPGHNKRNLGIVVRDEAGIKKLRVWLEYHIETLE